MPVRKVFGYKPDVPDKRDLHFRADYLKVGKLRQKLQAFLLPDFVDNSKDPAPSVYDQGNVGSCVGNATAGMLGHVTAHTGNPPESFSRLFIYGNARGWEPQDDGCTLRDAIKGVDKYGVPLEALWPYDTTKWAIQPPTEVYEAASYRHEIKYYRLTTLEGMRLCLSEGYPFIFGISIFDSFFHPVNGIIPMPRRGDSLQGGHALLAVGYDHQRRLLKFRNSWGEDWGQGGYAWLPYDYVRNTSPLVVELSQPLWMDAWTVRSIPY